MPAPIGKDSVTVYVFYATKGEFEGLFVKYMDRVDDSSDGESMEVCVQFTQDLGEAQPLEYTDDAFAVAQKVVEHANLTTPDFGLGILKATFSTNVEAV